MAAGALAKPGSKAGPCAEPCQHTDCAATRQMAESLCTECSEPIGYERAFYITDTGYEHAYCSEDKLAQEQHHAAS